MIYLDSAATSLLKPRSVHMAVQNAMRTMASPGRGGHRPALRAAETAYDCRVCLAELFKVPEPEDVVFTMNATHGAEHRHQHAGLRGGPRSRIRLGAQCRHEAAENARRGCRRRLGAGVRQRLDDRGVPVQDTRERPALCALMFRMCSGSYCPSMR